MAGKNRALTASGILTSFTQDDYDDGVATMVGTIDDQHFEQKWQICSLHTRDGKSTGWEQDAWYEIMEQVKDPEARLKILRKMAVQIDGPKLEYAK